MEIYGEMKEDKYNVIRTGERASMIAVKYAMAIYCVYQSIFIDILHCGQQLK